MRYALLIVPLLLVAACSSKNAAFDQADADIRVGLIKARDDVSLGQVEQERSRVNTSVSGSVSSGGGVSIGLGFLIAQFGSGGDDDDSVRYEVELLDGGQLTVYHESDEFEVDDCVEVLVYPDENAQPPEMRLSPDGCG